MSERGNLRGDDQAQNGEIDLRALGAGVMRRKRWILLPTLLAAVLAIGYVTVSSPYYRASTLVLIENNEQIAPRAGAEREPTLPDDQAVATQVQFIQSRDLVRKVAGALDLANDPEFAAGGASLTRRLMGFLGFGGPGEKLPVKEQVVDKVAENLAAYPVSGARVIGIDFISKNPDDAARIANGFVDAYFDIQRGAKLDLNRQATSYLSDEIDGLRKRVGDAEAKVEAFRSQAGLLVGQNNTTVAAQQLGEASTQLINARTQQAESRAKADTIRDYLKAGRAAEALDIANSELVRSLSQQRSQLVAQIASEGRTLLAQHPRMRELSAQLGGLDGQIRSEAEKLARAYETEAKSAGARVAALQAGLDVQKNAAANANGQDVQLRALEREARSQRDLLEQMLARYREASARDNPESLVANARIISRASAPTEPYFPKKGPIVALATIAAFVLSLFFAATAEIFGGGVRRLEDDGDAAPPPSVGVVPVFGKLHAPAQPASPISVAPPPPALSSPRSEAIEIADATLVASLARQLSAMPTADGALRILATGATRTVQVGDVVTQLARIMAESSRRIVVVDAGGGAPVVDKSGPGLAELLSGDATFAQAIHRDRGSRVHVVPKGALSFADLDPAARARLGVVLDALALTYDFVLLTAPGGGPVVDAFTAHCLAAILVSTAGAGDVSTVEAHDRLVATGIDDVVVLLVRDGDGTPDGTSSMAA